jgi:hypothetical protein
VQTPRVSHFATLDALFHILRLSTKLNTEEKISTESESTLDFIDKENTLTNVCGFKDTWIRKSWDLRRDYLFLARAFSRNHVQFLFLIFPTSLAPFYLMTVFVAATILLDNCDSYEYVFKSNVYSAFYWLSASSPWVPARHSRPSATEQIPRLEGFLWGSIRSLFQHFRPNQKLNGKDYRPLQGLRVTFTGVHQASGTPTSTAAGRFSIWPVTPGYQLYKDNLKMLR